MDRLQQLKRQVRDGLADPWTDATILLLVFVSVVLLPFEFGLPQSDPANVVATKAGHTLTLIFVVELTLRYWVAPRKRRFFQRYWTDILAVLPVIRPIRLFRVLRVLRLIRAGLLMNRSASWRGTAAEASAVRLMILATMSAMLVLFGSFILQQVEPNDLSGPQASLWFSVFSLIAGEPVGGEPQTLIGKSVTLMLMMGGLTVFGLFVATVSATMIDSFHEGLLMREIELDELTDHVLVCGWNGSGATLLRELFHGRNQARRFVVLITEGDAPKDLPHDLLDSRTFFHHKGDYTRIEVLEAVGAPNAATAILLTDHSIPRSDQDRDARTVLAALTMERMAPNLYTVAEVTSRQSESLLSMAGVEEIVVGDWYAGMILGSASRNRGLVGVLDEVLSHSHGNAFHTVKIPMSRAGSTIAKLRQELHDTHEATLIALHSGEQRLVNPPGTRRLAIGDQAVVLSADPPHLR